MPFKFPASVGIVAAAGKWVHVVQRPDNRTPLEKIKRERGVKHASHPVQMHQVKVAHQRNGVEIAELSGNGEVFAAMRDIGVFPQNPLTVQLADN